MAPAALTTLYCTAPDVEALLSVQGEADFLDDDAAGAVNQAQKDRLMAYALNYATERVNFYCLNLYAASDLASSWLVNQWATIIAARWLASRRVNPVPQSLQEAYEETLKDLELVRTQKVELPSAPTREAAWPAWSNVRVDPFYQVRQVRVERPISERSPVTYPQHRDLASEFIAEPD